jgi:aryl-alcohol dehydrogenase-like predicted oxidoreductase
MKHWNNIFAPRRTLGNTGFSATRLGIGDLADRQLPLETCAETVRRALDAGLNVIDTAPGYEDGYSEEIVGAALRGRRNGVFVIDKIDHPGQPVAPQVEASLGRLGIETADLFALHGVSDPEIWRAATGPGGAMEQLDACRHAGKVRFRGISSHSPEVLREAILSGLCDVVLFPVGPGCDPRYMSETLPLARERGVGTVCFKTFGAGKLLGDTPGYNQPLRDRPRGKVSSGGGEADAPALPHMTAAECLHYTLTCDPDVALLGMSFPNEQDEAFAAALSFTPLDADQLAALRREALRALEGKGNCWWNPEPLTA